MKLHSRLTIAIALAALAATSAIARDARMPGDHAIEREAARKEIRQQLAPIRSASELKAYLRDTPASLSPFEALSPLARERFVRSLRFNAAGIAGYRYDDLEAELTASQIHRLLALFGSQDDVRLMKGAGIESSLDRTLIEEEAGEMPSTDYPAYECESPGNCKKKSGSICKSTC